MFKFLFYDSDKDSCIKVLMTNNFNLVSNKHEHNLFVYMNSIWKYFLDPVGSLVPTLWVGYGWVVGCHTFSKLVNFECCSVVMMIDRVFDWKSVRLEDWKSVSLQDWNSVSLQDWNSVRV